MLSNRFMGDKNKLNILLKATIINAISNIKINLNHLRRDGIIKKDNNMTIIGKTA